ncbi:MAG TPA: spore germination protein [Thermaerobacter sp.]
MHATQPSLNKAIPREPRVTGLREHLEAVRGELERWLAELALGRTVPARPADLVRLLEDALGRPSDLILRRLRLGRGVGVLVTALEGMAGDALLNDFVLRPLLERGPAVSAPVLAGWLDGPGLPGGNVQCTRDVRRVVESLLNGHAVIHVEGLARAWLVDVRQFNHRSINDPATEGTVGGPREAFVEVLRVNTATVRRRVASPLLRMEELTVGRVSRTRVAVLYIAGRADPGTVAEVRRRLEMTPWDMLFSEQQVEALLEDRSLSLFPQVRTTERPDVCAAALSEGRVVVLVDGTPFAVIVPVQFWDLLQSPDDYYLRWPFATALRAVRLGAVLLMTMGLPLYVAITTYNQELIPREFLFSLAASREGLPLPTVVEALALSLFFDLVREASTRLPRQIGGALTIVGGLVIGDTAVRAGLVTAPTLIIIGASAVGALVLPSFTTAIPFRVLHYVFLITASVLGLFGMALAALLVVAHMASLRSLGVPYLTPFAPMRPEGHEDALIRAPFLAQQGPPPLIGTGGNGPGDASSPGRRP